MSKNSTKQFGKITASELLEKFKAMFPRIFQSEAVKNAIRAMKTADIDTLRKNSCVEAWLEDLPQYDSITAAQEAANELWWEDVYFIYERYEKVVAYLSALPSTHPMLAPRSGREQFVWLLINIPSIQKDEERAPVW